MGVVSFPYSASLVFRYKISFEKSNMCSSLQYFYFQLPHACMYRGRILFSPCYSQSPLLPTFGFLGPEISKADFKLTQPLTYFFKLMQPLTYYTVNLLYTVKGRGGKSDRKPYPLSYGLRNPYRTSSLRALKIMPRNLKEIIRW